MVSSLFTLLKNTAISWNKADHAIKYNEIDTWLMEPSKFTYHTSTVYFHFFK